MRDSIRLRFYDNLRGWYWDDVFSPVYTYVSISFMEGKRAHDKTPQFPKVEQYISGVLFYYICARFKNIFK